MSETTLHSDDHTGAQTPIQNPRYKFTLEELRTLKECNRESFWTRSVPLCSVFTLGVYAGIKKGVLQPSPRFGALPKVSIAVTVGYFLGKLMYQPKCIEKIMQLPNSPLADMLRKQSGRGIVASETMALEPGFYSAAPSTPSSSSPRMNEQTGHLDVMDTRPIHNFDNDSSTFTGVDYGKADTTDQMLDDSNLPPKPPQYQQTYDDLRRKNRIEYETKMHSPGIVSKPPNPNEPPQRPDYTMRDTTPGSPKRKNMYGDVWDDVQNPRS